MRTTSAPPAPSANRCTMGTLVVVVVISTRLALAGVGDPQVRTDHVWYPGELACSSFERLFETQAKLYQHVVGRLPETDEDKALAAWLWRNTHYFHGEEGAEDLFDRGFTGGGDLRSREYWTGLFAHGFGLCGTTHSQWTAELNALFGHGRSRGVGVDGHNACEVYLKGGAYGTGRWALLDHDLSTVIFAADGSRLLSIQEVNADLQRLIDRSFQPQRQRGWLIAGLHADDAQAYRRYQVVEHLPGYAGPPPMVHLRRGESMRRYLQPGLDDGRTFVFWGRNYNTGGIPGPERAQTWVNQPEKMFGSTRGAGYHPGQTRFGNVVYTYRPNFADGSFREGVIGVPGERGLTFEFHTPYIIGATPPNDKAWGIYDAGCRNGLVLQGQADCRVSLSTNRGASWHACGTLTNGLDLTDHVKGRRLYWIRFDADERLLAASGLSIVTVCQANAATMPRLKDDDTSVQFAASGNGIVSAGPNLAQAQQQLVSGKFGSRSVTLELATPRSESIRAIHAAAHIASSNPPDPEIKYQIDYALDGGAKWQPMIKEWQIPRTAQEPGDCWSQSLCWGTIELPQSEAKKAQVRFHNNGGKSHLRAEMHLVYELSQHDSAEVTFHWHDSAGAHTQARRVAPYKPGAPAENWQIQTARQVVTRWVEISVK